MIDLHKLTVGMLMLGVILVSTDGTYRLSCSTPPLPALSVLFPLLSGFDYPSQLQWREFALQGSSLLRYTSALPHGDSNLVYTVSLPSLTTCIVTLFEDWCKLIFPQSEIIVTILGHGEIGNNMIFHLGSANTSEKLEGKA